MADQDAGALEAWLAEVETDIVTKQLIAAELRRRLGRAPTENGTTGAPQFPAAGGGYQPFGQVGRIRSDEFFRLSIPDAIQKYLSIMKSPQGPKTIVEGLKAGGLLTNATNFYANVTTALKRLRVAGKADLTPNGWGLTEWYPTKPKGKAVAKKAKKRRTRKAGNTRKPAPIAAPETKGAGSYREFVGKTMKDGKSMTEAAALWKKQKAGA